MYEYKFEHVDLKGFFDRTPESDYHDLINRNATDGWRLVQIFAPPLKPRAESYYEIIFERKIES